MYFFTYTSEALKKLFSFCPKSVWFWKMKLLIKKSKMHKIWILFRLQRNQKLPTLSTTIKNKHFHIWQDVQHERPARGCFGDQGMRLLGSIIVLNNSLLLWMTYIFIFTFNLCGQTIRLPKYFDDYMWTLGRKGFCYVFIK